MNTLKPLAFTVLTVLLAAAAAASFGSFASQTEKTVGSHASFKINVFNLGKQDYKLEIKSEKVEGARIYHPDSYTVAPSERTRNPQGGGNWFTLGNGKYIRTAEIPIDFQKLPGSNKRNFEFTVTITAKPEAGSREEGSTYHRIQQVRTYTFNVETSATQRKKEESFKVPSKQQNQNSTRQGPLETVQRTLNSLNPFNKASNTRQSPEITVKKSESNPGKTNQSFNPQTGTDNQTETNRQTGGFFASGSHLTLVLLAGVATTALYLFRVM